MKFTYPYRRINHCVIMLRITENPALISITLGGANEDGAKPVIPSKIFSASYFVYSYRTLWQVLQRTGATYLRKKLLICFLMNARSPRNFPYILWRTVFRKSRSRGSSLSKSSKSWSTNFWSMTFFPMLGWKSGDSRKRKKNSYTSWKLRKKGEKF